MKFSTDLGLFIGLVLLGLIVSKTALIIKSYERTVVVKGLSEQEHPADIVVWPIRYVVASDSISPTYKTILKNNKIITDFLHKNGVKPEEIIIGSPSLKDNAANEYTTKKEGYSGEQKITVYSENVDLVRKLMTTISILVKNEIVFSAPDYSTKPEFIFTKLSDVKPQMVEEATKNARTVAYKFANDSNSKLGKIKRARQGNFSINSRDENTPHIKKIRVVTTVEYYLSD